MANLHTVAVAAELASRPTAASGGLAPGTYTNTKVIVDATGTVQSIKNGPNLNLALTRVDTENGSYLLYPDGTLQQWGTVSVPASGTDFNSASFIFPTPFTVIPVCTVSLLGLPNDSEDTTTPAACELLTLSTDGGEAYMAKVIVASEGGGTFDNETTLQWQAYGH